MEWAIGLPVKKSALIGDIWKLGDVWGQIGVNGVGCTVWVGGCSRYKISGGGGKIGIFGFFVYVFR
jgi:hypothetical protein